jgi:hypothetical protein
MKCEEFLDNSEWSFCFVESFSLRLEENSYADPHHTPVGEVAAESRRSINTAGKTAVQLPKQTVSVVLTL